MALTRGDLDLPTLSLTRATLPADLEDILHSSKTYIEDHYILAVLEELLRFCNSSTALAGVREHPLGGQEHTRIISIAIGDVQQFKARLSHIPRRAGDGTLLSDAYLEWRRVLEDSLVNPESEIHQVCYDGTASASADQCWSTRRLFTPISVRAVDLVCSILSADTLANVAQ